VSIYRRAKKVDASQGPIIAALRCAGIAVWVIGQPCDLLTYYPPLKRWRPLECKPEDPHNRNRRDQAPQKEFLATYAVPVVRTALEAIQEVTR
jgi:hypothetical protein